MKGVFLDCVTVLHSSLNLTSLEQALPDCTYYPGTKRAEVLVRCQGMDVVITNKVVFSAELLKELPNLKLICVTATGLDNIDLDTANKLGIKVCNVSNYSTDAVVQHTFGLLINLYTNMHRYMESVKQHAWQQSQQFCLNHLPCNELAGKVLGIVGYGAIGKKVAQVASAFGMRVLIAQSLEPGVSKPDRTPLLEMLGQVDILSLHCPLTEATRGIISSKELSLMKPSAVLLNMARGGVVDEAALMHSLITKQISAAAIDVLTQEPPDSNVAFFKNKNLPENLLITPHNAWASLEARQRLIEGIANNITQANLKKTHA